MLLQRSVTPAHRVLLTLVLQDSGLIPLNLPRAPNGSWPSARSISFATRFSTADPLSAIQLVERLSQATAVRTIAIRNDRVTGCHHVNDPQLTGHGAGCSGLEVAHAQNWVGPGVHVLTRSGLTGDVIAAAV